MDQITVTVLIKDNKFKGLIGPNTSFPNSHWWDSELQVSVPKADWEAEKVTITTIRNYMNSSSNFWNIKPKPSGL